MSLAILFSIPLALFFVILGISMALYGVSMAKGSTDAEMVRSRALRVFGFLLAACGMSMMAMIDLFMPGATDMAWFYAFLMIGNIVLSVINLIELLKGDYT